MYALPSAAVPHTAPPHRRRPQVGFAASFASKLADTTSSEIGKAYGQTTYLVTTLQVGVQGSGWRGGDVAEAVGAGPQWGFLGMGSADVLC